MLRCSKVISADGNAGLIKRSKAIGHDPSENNAVEFHAIIDASHLRQRGRLFARWCGVTFVHVGRFVIGGFPCGLRFADVSHALFRLHMSGIVEGLKASLLSSS